MTNKQFDLFENTEAKKREDYTQKDKADKIDTYKGSLTEVTWAQLLSKIITALKVPFTAAKYQLSTKIKEYFTTRPFPWFKVSLVLIFLYLFFQKDMSLQVNTNDSNSFISGDKNASELSMTGFAQAASISNKEASSQRINLKDQDIKSYINRFSKVAIVEMQKYNIPASIKMGQALLASHAGQNALAKNYNNHFGTVCSGGDNCKDFDIGHQTVQVSNYRSAWQSWRAHSEILSSGSYNELKKYGKNYKNWAKGLEQMGYGNNNNYSQQLIQVIENYQLYQLDELNENL